jgi:high-affinity iron transporter
LTPQEQARRAGQLYRFLGLVPTEYGRGVKAGMVTADFEIQEALTFRDGAEAAFDDLQALLGQRDAAKTARIAALLDDLQTQLEHSATRVRVADPAQIQETSDEIVKLVTEIAPPEWSQRNSDGDFDVIASMLDQMEQAAAAENYTLAESARLEAYAILESGPEARLVAAAPQLKTPIEDLFWFGQGEEKGLAFLIRERAPIQKIKASRDALDAQLALAQSELANSSAPFAVATNASIIVFREGLEAVLILAALMSSLKIGEMRKYRKGMWLGVALAFLVTVLTWLVAGSVLNMLARYGEMLEAVVSLIAVGVLLLILNWFFHKVYWTGWISGFHTRKRAILGQTAGQMLGLVILGFTSVYREGFEVVLFLQALVLEAGAATVLMGVAIGLAGVILVGVAVFGLQARLPYKKMLIVTGVMIAGVLLVMVGNTIHVMQVVGWMSITPLRFMNPPYWMGIWFGIYPTVETLAAQALAFVYVVGSYYLAERQTHRNFNQSDSNSRDNKSLPDSTKASRETPLLDEAR